MIEMKDRIYMSLAAKLQKGNLPVEWTTAVLEIMREPTPEMEKAGAQILCNAIHEPYLSNYGLAAKIFTAMINAALIEKKTIELPSDASMGDSIVVEGPAVVIQPIQETIKERKR